jgi:hypothetical protein
MTSKKAKANPDAKMPWLMKHAALSYATQWFMTDRALMRGLFDAGSSEVNAAMLGELAAKYMVARGFKKDEGGAHSSNQRWIKAAVHLKDSVLRDEPVRVKVRTLAIDLGRVAPVQSATGTNLLSASTKFLWFAGEHKVRILDRRAVEALGRLRGRRGKLGSDYALYDEVWQEQYDEHQDALGEAVAELPGQLAWSLIPSQEHGEAKAVFKEPWFIDRVFDKYLWTLGVSAEGGATSFV